MTTIIGLLGPAGAGKSEVAKYLTGKYGAVEYALADPLKQFAARVFELSEGQLYGTQQQKETIDERYNVTPRWLLQRLGTQGFRAMLGENFWVELLLKKVLEEDAPYLAVVSDVRFISEAEGVRNAGAQVWRIINEKKVSNADASHQSEAEWSKCPYDSTIAHDGVTLSNLHAQIDALCYLNHITPVTLINKWA